jgi:hypothetical protein
VVVAVVAVSVELFSVIVVDVALGLVDDPYMIDPDRSVMSTLEVEVAFERLMVIAEITSVPTSVAKVN